MIDRRRLRVGVAGLLVAVAGAAIVANRHRPWTDRTALDRAWDVLRRDHAGELARLGMTDPDDCDCAVSVEERSPSRTVGNLWFPGRDRRTWRVLIARRGAKQARFDLVLWEPAEPWGEPRLQQTPDDEFGPNFPIAWRSDCRTSERRRLP